MTHTTWNSERGLSMKQAKRRILNDIEDLSKQLQKLSPYQSVMSVKVPDEIGLWDRNKIQIGLDYVKRIVNANFNQEAHTIQANALIKQIKAAVAALKVLKP